MMAAGQVGSESSVGVGGGGWMEGEWVENLGAGRGGGDEVR